MAHHRFIAILIGLGMMSACSDGEDRERTAQNDNGTDLSLSIGGGNVSNPSASLRSDGNSSTVAIDLPGIKGKFQLPKLKLGSGDVDIDGVRLYPGSRVKGIDVGGQEGASEGLLTVRFEADAPPATVQRYFLDAFRDKGVHARAQGSGIVGADHAGKPFAIDLNAVGEGSRGEIRVGHKPG